MCIAAVIGQKHGRNIVREEDLNTENKDFKGIRMQNNEVIDKDMPKRPISIGAYTDGEQIPGCPMCVKRISIGQRKCDNCGQVIYWRK